MFQGDLIFQNFSTLIAWKSCSVIDVLPCMRFEGAWVATGLPALLTRKWPFSRVNSCVDDQIVLGFKTFPTYVTWKVLFLHVNSLVLPKITGLCKSFAANVTHMAVSHQLVDPLDVCLQILTGLDSLFTVGTLEATFLVISS